MLFSRITGTGSYLPAREVSNAELALRIETSDQWIRDRTGIESRHLAAEGETSSDMGLHAARRAMEAAGVRATDIDLIIFGTTTPDMMFPASACLLQDKLGIRGCAAFDVQAACSGFVYGAAIADKFVRSGQSRCALVVGAEVMSRMLDWTDRRSCVLFGDGAGAAIIQPSDEPGILSSHLHADGSAVPILHGSGAISHGKISGNPYVFMDGPAVFKIAVKVLEEVVHEVLAEHHLTAADIDWFVPHQANIRIINATAQRLGIKPEQVVLTLARHGNTSAASIPLALDAAVRDGRIRRGQTVLMESVGGGLTWGALLVRW